MITSKKLKLKILFLSHYARIKLVNTSDIDNLKDKQLGHFLNYVQHVMRTNISHRMPVFISFRKYIVISTRTDDGYTALLCVYVNKR